MESSENPGAPEDASADPPDWELLSALFATGGNHRHRMGLRRAGTRDYYAATIHGGAVRNEKQAILDRVGKRHTLATPEGHRAAVEFAASLGLPLDGAEADNEETRQVFNRRLSLALEPDLLFVQPPDWSLVWANVCFPSRWSLDGKTRRPLAEIHAAVPGLNPELGSKIATFFARLAPGEGWRRANWGLSASARRNQHPDEFIPPLTAGSRPDQIFIRIEDQHLLKLPETGAIAFGIRIANYAWTDVTQNPVIALALQDALRSMSPQLAQYKAINELIPGITDKFR